MGFGLDKLLGMAGPDRQYGPVTVHDRPLRCQICLHDQFWEHRVQLHTPAATFLDVEFLNRVANCAVCGSCGYVHIFLPPPAIAHEPSEVEERA